MTWSLLAPTLFCQNTGSRPATQGHRGENTDNSSANYPDAPVPAGSAPAPAAQQPALPIVVQSSVTVNSEDDTNTKPAVATTQYHATSKQIESSAGTYSDLSRYLQLFPGVVFNSDLSNDVLVRGGNPIENLYLVDGIEVPNINQIETGATTGGLVSMIDSSAINSIDFQTGGYDSSYEERLSSVISIHSREFANDRTYTAADIGFVGTGFIRQTSFKGDGSLLITAHRSLLNLFTNDIGLNGVPIYTNAFSRAEWNPTSADEVSIDSLGGFDSLNITPTNDDKAETSTINMQYSGWRFTNGVRWRHTYSPQSFGVWTLSDSEDDETIHQEDQLFNNFPLPGYNTITTPLTPVYSQLTHDGVTNLRYDGYHTSDSGLSLAFGASGHVYRIDYDVAQPYGEQSPLSPDPSRSDATSFYPHFWTGETGYYVQATKTLGKWSFDGGGRLQQFAFGSHLTATPRLGAALQLTDKVNLHAGFSEYRQLPPFLQLTSYSQNRFLEPIKVTHYTAGLRWNVAQDIAVNLEVYRKEYGSYPVSTDYPSLSLANMVDTLGEEFIWLPFTSQGRGYAKGVELSTDMRLNPHLELHVNASLAKNEFTGLDGIYRPGNFDYPFVLNAAGRYTFARRYGLSWRYEYTTGRPYTPFLPTASTVQNRPVYDLSHINAERAPFYSRLDFRANRIFSFGTRQLSLYGGLQNAFDRQNFLGMAWLPRYDLTGACEKSVNACIVAQNQMGIFPDFGAVFTF
ncbi:TonB-dependent receptor plug domain-containing protein [Silvibacterium acidisoli]|uniref:TonB-dependent receptor plug domain-containing protein n=1 Tax=Acidobacteriaceae bacterium ZG23-2 TaxID=2883246 RepID=UPI00406CB121